MPAQIRIVIELLLLTLAALSSAATNHLVEPVLAQGQLELALQYDNGRDVSQDRVEAAQLFWRAGEEGVAQAEAKTGKTYLDIDAGPQGAVEVAQWLHKAAAQGDSEAQNKYGMLLATGKGVAQNYMEALDWYKKSAAQGHSQAQYNLGRAYLDGQGEDREHNPRKAAHWFRKAADNDNRHAQVQLGKLLERGLGVPAPNLAEAGSWYLRAATLGDPIAQFNVGIMYDTTARNRDFGVEKDDRLAIAWYTKAATQGYPQAGYNVGLMHRQGRGTHISPTQAVRFWKRAAEEGHPQAQFNMGLAHFKGYGTEQNLKTAAFWYEEAAEQNVVSAQYTLGFLYENGQGVEQNVALAKKWYQRASDAGDLHAKSKILGFTFGKAKMPVSEQNVVMQSLGRIKDSLEHVYHFNPGQVKEPSTGIVHEEITNLAANVATRENSLLVLVSSLVVTTHRWSFSEVMLLFAVPSLALMQLHRSPRQ